MPSNLPAPTPEITLYDLASNLGKCFSPTVLRIRLLLNYKHIAYKVVFLEFPEIQPTLTSLGFKLPDGSVKYTVPAMIHHPSNTHIIDSTHIANFINETYPSNPIIPTTPSDDAILLESRKLLAPMFQISLTPREVHILNPASQAYFRDTREQSLGRTLESLLEGDNEDKAWNSAWDGLKALEERLRELRGEKRFLFGDGDVPSYMEFIMTGALESARLVHEATFRRVMELKGFEAVYQSCAGWICSSIHSE